MPDKMSVKDVARKVKKSEGGLLSPDNTEILNPVDHMQKQGILRVRTPEMENLKSIIDDREQLRKLGLQFENQLLARRRGTDNLRTSTIIFLEEQLAIFSKRVTDQDKLLKKEIEALAKTDRFIKCMLNVRGIGPVTIAYCLVYIDLEKARHASHLWSYTGLHVASHERYKKGVAGGGNKKLRTVLYNMAQSQIKTRGPYREVYDEYKARLEVSEVITDSRNTQGQLIKCMWKDTKPGHRNGAAIRRMMKYFLVDYWITGRRHLGLPIDALYPEAILGGNHRTSMPDERGWHLDDK